VERLNRAIPYFKKKWLDDTYKKIQNYEYSNNYDLEFEEQLKDYFSIKHAILVSSATVGLMVTLKSMNLTKDDSVLVSDYGHPAAYNTCKFLNLNFHSVPMDSNTKAMDLKSLEESIIKMKAKVLIHIETNGWVTESIQNIRDICDKYNVFLLEDSAPSFGQRFKNKLAGTFGDAGVFSFSPTKTLYGGEGGLVITNNDELAEKIKLLQTTSCGSLNKATEGNFNISPFTTILLQNQFNDLDFILNERERIHNEYSKYLNIYKTKDVTNYYGAVTLFAQNTEHIKNSISKFGIEGRIFPYPSINNYPESIKLINTHIDLPNHFYLTNEQIQRISNYVNAEVEYV
jgi:dTDP-4-amino-4,6-dideoxygalactose transaminase